MNLFKDTRLNSKIFRGQQTWSTPVKRESVLRVPCALCGGGRFKPYLRCGDDSKMSFDYVRCADCGLVQINPQPESRAVQSRYDESYLDYELKNESSFFNLGKLALGDAGIERIERNAFERGNRRALEIGCATGAVLEYLKNRGWDAQGVEISAQQADYARARRGLEVSALPLEENHFNGESFSLVYASHLIEHLNAPADFLREVRRILSPSGRLIVTTPNIDGFQARLFGKRWRSAIFDHLYLFSKKTLSRLLRETGFAAEKTVTWGGIAQGFAPPKIKRVMDIAAKRFGFGDVMLFVCRSA